MVQTGEQQKLRQHIFSVSTTQSFRVGGIVYAVCAGYRIHTGSAQSSP